jgi:hypothetical protein
VYSVYIHISACTHDVPVSFHWIPVLFLSHSAGILWIPVDSCPIPVDSCPIPVDSCPIPVDSCPIPVDFCPIPVDFCPIPVDSCPIPVDSGGFLQEWEGHCKVLHR